jgi:uncharacterized membrane protein HdeD (DUF308 family)
MSTDFVKSKVAGAPWWLVLIEGVAALILGILLLLAPGKALVALVGVVGLYFLVRGILYIVEIFHDASQWLAKLIAGILAIAVGIIVVRHPAWAAALVPAALGWTVGIGTIAVGAIGLGQALSGEGWWRGILGFFAILIGIAFIFNPLNAASIVPVILGIAGVGVGIVGIVWAFRLK